MVDPYVDDEKPAPSEWDGSLRVDSNGNEYNPWAGSQSRTEGRCNAVLTNWQERYGEKRYCAKYPMSHFVDDGSEFCSNHECREQLYMQHKENYEHGGFVSNYSSLFDVLPLEKQLFAVELFDSLMDESKYNFERERVEHVVVNDDEKSMAVDVPIPTQKTARAQALWYASLDFIRMQDMQEVLFTDAYTDEDEGLMGQQASVVTNEEGVVTDDEGEPLMEMDEHHLNLPISRVAKDHKEYLRLGGVDDRPADDDNVELREVREWKTAVKPEADDHE